MTVPIRLGRSRVPRRAMPAETMRLCTEEIWNLDCPAAARNYHERAGALLEAMPDWLLTDTIAAAAVVQARAEEVQRARGAVTPGQ